jgi:hypothetical protein
MNDWRYPDIVGRFTTRLEYQARVHRGTEKK